MKAPGTPPCTGQKKNLTLSLFLFLTLWLSQIFLLYKNSVALEKECNQNMTDVCTGKAPAGWEGLILTAGEETGRLVYQQPINQGLNEGHWLCFI